MSQSLTRLIVHAIFSTKNREPILSAEVRPELHAHIGGILNSLDCVPLAIKGTDDHVHMLFIQSKKYHVGESIRGSEGNVFVLDQNEIRCSENVCMAGGYGAFSESESRRQKVSDYIAHQEEHHHKLSFKEKLIALLKKHHIEYDEKYLWT
jgi:REP element-mobilizing transposase RayT